MVPTLIPNDMYNRRDTVLPIAHEQGGRLGRLAQESVQRFVFAFVPL